MTGLAAALDQISLAELRRRASLKWTAGGPEVLGAFVAEMDFGTAPAVEEALRAAMSRHAYGYLPPAAATELSATVAAWLAGQGWTVDPARIKPLPDVIKGLEAAISVFSRPGSPVVLPTPAYMPFLTVPPALGRKIIQVPMVTDGGRLALDLDGIAAAFRAGGHLLILCNPCNPAGRVYTRDELRAVAAVVDAHGGRVFADEIHAPLVYAGHRYVPYASVSATAAGHAITATSASKGWNLPGVKCAQLILSNEADEATWVATDAAVLYERGTSTLGVAANIAAFARGQDWLAEVVGYLDGNRVLLADLLAERLPAVRYRPPEGTYLAWLDCRSLGLGDSPGEFFLDRAQVLVNDGPAFGDAGRGHVRLNFATPRPILTRIVTQLAAAVSSAGRP
ncbi:MAG TPA: aminotransferase class I/II-fold pyridoxal phosphate-dependent enzyme [Streptosporangiaceae bacterium]|nr:aminotransferase class I/II-fold pyridoxal phosphate-dependent enzyme [Streptosporangiaceae bacterium]